MVYGQKSDGHNDDVQEGDGETETVKIVRVKWMTVKERWSQGRQ